MLSPLAALSVFQAIREEFVPTTWQAKLTLLNWIPHRSGWVWATLGLVICVFIILESAFRLIRAKDTENLQLKGDDVTIAMAILRSHGRISSGEYITRLQLFAGLARDLALGITEWTMPNKIRYHLGRPVPVLQLASGVSAQEYFAELDSEDRMVNSPYSHDPEEDEIRSIIADMILARVIAIERRPGLPNREGVYRTTQNMPANVYRITDLGQRVVTRLRNSVSE